MGTKRNILLDNIRAVLIILVVFGHILERLSFPGSKWLYLAIYSFHMPAMTFLSGLCFRRNKTTLWKTTLLPYLLFQVLYLAELAWEKGEPLALQFSTPSWILWYLLSLFFWQMLTNLIDLRSKPLLPLVLSLLCALLVGLDTRIGYFFSLSRTIVFFPFYLAGACIRENGYDGFCSFFEKRKSPVLYGLLLAPAMLTQILLFRQQHLCQNYFFYFAVGYDEQNTIAVRCLIFLSAAAAITALFTLAPKQRVPLLSYIGRNTLPVYLLHGVLLRVLTHLRWIYGTSVPRPLLACLIASLLVLLLSSPPVVLAFKAIFHSEALPFRKIHPCAEGACPSDTKRE